MRRYSVDLNISIQNFEDSNLGDATPPMSSLLKSLQCKMCTFMCKPLNSKLSLHMTRLDKGPQKFSLQILRMVSRKARLNFYVFVSRKYN